MRSKWDRLWQWFDESFRSMEREMHKIQNDQGTVQVLYEDGHLHIKVNGLLKTVNVNGKQVRIKCQ